ncbi:MAG TPA: PAS domain-containing protein [Povalibacter sp.]|nr:PAS domain-containing protein [Povalibacter sp.]
MTAAQAPLDSFAALDAVASAVLVAGARTTDRPVIHANPAFTQLTGYSRSTALGRDVMFLTGPQSDPEIVQELREAVFAGKPFAGDIVLHTNHHEPLPTRVTVQPVHDALGAPSHLIVTIENIAKISQLRDSLRANAARLQVAIDSSGLSMWDWDVTRDAVYYNEHWRESLGVDPNELLNRVELPDRLMLPADQSAVLEQFEQHFHGVTPHFECEYALPGASGEMKWFAARAEVVRRDPRGKPLRMIGVLRDISRRKHELQNAMEVQERWERAVRGTSDGLYDWDLLTGHVWYATRFREILGYGPDELPDTFMAFQNVLHPDDRMLVLDKIRKHLENQKPLDIRCRIEARNGAFIWCRMRGQAERDAAGRPLRLAGSISDINAQIDAEEALSRSQDFYGTILDSLPLLISYADRDQRVVYANRPFQEFFQVPLASSRGYAVSDVLGDRRYGAIGPYLRKALQGATVEAQGRFRNPAGKTVDIEAVFVPHRDETGDIQGCFVAARDVTEKRQLEAELRQSQKMEAVGQLTGGIAHDFNNLLSVIVGNMQLLARSLRESPRLRRQAETALKAAIRGGELTRRLLAFARQQVLEPRVVDMNALVGGMYELLRRSLTGDIEIRLVLEPQLWAARVDPGQLENAVLNLVINARDAMPEGGGTITIVTGNRTVAADADGRVPAGQEIRPGDYAVLEVSDSGVGMTSETLKRVFEPFFTTKDVGKGSGLGLPMVYGFVRQSGGHVCIDSAVGKGTSVRLLLPRTQANTEPVREAVREPDPTGELPQGRETILVVEDNAEVRATALDILGSLGYRLLEATNGYQALEQFMQHPDVALVFSDVMLPGGLPGTGLVEKLRERRPQLKVLMTSAFSESGILNRGLLDGSLELLTKPYRVEDLARRVRAILDGKEETKRVPA